MSAEGKAPKDSVYALIRKAEQTAGHDAPAAMQISQAALNAANAIATIRDTESRESSG